MNTWGDVFNHYKRKGCDPSDAAYRADMWEKRRNALLALDALEAVQNGIALKGKLADLVETAIAHLKEAP